MKAPFPTAADSRDARWTATLIGIAVGAFVGGSCTPVLTPDDVILRPQQVILVGPSVVNGTVAQALANPIRVRVVDDEGIAMPHRVVAFVASAGTVTPATAITDARGEAQATSWTLPTQSGTHTLTARAQKHDDDDPEPITSITAQVTPGPATSISATTSATSAPVNTTLVVSVTARDQYGNGVSGVRISAQPGESPSNAAVTSSNPATSNSSGLATFTWRLDTIARSNTLRFTGVDEPMLTAASTTQGTAGTPSRMTSVSQRSQTGTPETAVASTPEVRVADQYDNPVDGASVVFSLTSGNGTLTPVSGTCGSNLSCLVTSGANGLARLGSWVLPAGLGAYTLNVVVSGSSLALSPPFTAQALRDLHVTELTAPASGTIGESIQVSATIANNGGIAAPAFTVTFRISSNNIISTSDVQAPPSCAVPGLAGGATFICTQNIALPTSLTSGSWYVGAVADEANAVTETDEANNTRVTSGTIALSLSIPTAPTSLTATGVSSSGIHLAWTDNSTNETGFRIERCLGSGCSSFVELATVGANVTSYASTSLSAGSMYSYRVRAYNSAGNSTYTNVATAAALTGGIDLTLGSVSGPSTVNTHQALNAVATLVNAGESAAGAYDVTFYLSTNTIISSSDILLGSCPESGLAAGASRTLTCTVVVPASTIPGTYFLGAIIDASNAVAESRESNNALAASTSMSVTVIAPLAPSSLIATAVSSSQVNLTWSDGAATEDGFRIERCTGAGCTTFGEIGTTAANVATFASTALSPGTMYRFRVRAYNSGGSSAYTNIADATTPAGADLVITTAPVAPATATLGSSISGSMVVRNQGDIASGSFRIGFYFSVDNVITTADTYSGSSCTVTVSAGDSFTCGISVSVPSGMSAGTYFLGVIADDQGVVPESNEANNAAASTGTISIAPPTPAAPSTLTANAVAATQIDLAWSDNSSTETSFRIERCAGASCSDFVEIGSVGANVTVYSSTGLTSLTSYSYRVRAVNAGGSSPYSNTATAIAGGVPAAPSGVVATPVTHTQINLSWSDNASNEDGFRVERCQGSGCISFTEIATTGPNTTSYTSTGLSSTTTYAFRVRSYHGSGMSGYSNTAEATTQATFIDLTGGSMTAPATALSGQTISVTSLITNTGTGAAGAFRVGFYVSTNATIDASDTYTGAFCSITVVAAGGNTSCNRSVTLPTLSPGTYYIGVIVDDLAQVVESNETNNGAGVSFVVGTVPNAPSNLVVTGVSTSQINLSWTDNSSNEDGFRIERCTGAFCTGFSEITTVGTNVLTYSNTGRASATTYTYRVRSYNALGHSAYTAHVSSVTRGLISQNSLINGNLVGAESLNPLRSLSYYHDWEFTLSSTRTIQIDLAGSFDPYLQLLDNSGTLISFNDDATASTLASQIIITLAAGTYVIRATTFNNFATGSYQLALTY